MNIGIIIQARIASTRLPKKIILPIVKGESTSFLDVLLSKITSELPSIKTVLATSIESQNDILEEYAKKHEIHFFRGSENNVLKRFVDCAKEHDLDIVIRICSDNPYLDMDLLKSLISNYNNEDYFSYSVNDKPSILTHYGFFAEIVKRSTLEEVLKDSNRECCEHVTNCIYTHKNRFNIKFTNIQIKEPYIRCTLDTPLDFENLQYIYKHWYLLNKEKDYKSLLNFLSTKVDIVEKMKLQILNNNK